MAACGSLQKRPSLIESLSSKSPWKPLPPVNLRPPSDHPYTEIFGEIHFKQDPKPDSESSFSTPAFPIDEDLTLEHSKNGQDDKWVLYSQTGLYSGSSHRRSESLSSESLQLCTESLGFESLDDVKGLKIESLNNNNNNNNNDKNNEEGKMRERVNVRERYSQARNKQKEFPPPVSCIGKTGKPLVCFESYREDGRLLLKEIRIPTQEFLHACREDGRLRLCFVQPSVGDDDDDNNDNTGDEEEEGGGGGGGGEIEESEDNVRKDEAEIKTDLKMGYS